MKIINIITVLFILPIIAYSQVVRSQMIGRVVDSGTNTGIEGVEVQLLNTGDIAYTDSEGKFKFENSKGFDIGEPNYSFNIQKEGYIIVSNTNNRVVFGSGSIENLLMRKDIDKHLWITVLDGRTGDFIEDVKIEIKGNVKKTNSFGKVNFDLSQYGSRKIKVSLSKDCYKDQIEEIDNKGEAYLKLIPTCSQDDVTVKGIDLNNAILTLDRAMEARDGSNQGQVNAIELLLKNGYTYNNADFKGVALENSKLTNTDLTSCDFQTCNLKNAIFTESKLDNANLNFTNFKGANFNNCKSTSTRYHYARGSNSTFAKASLTNSSFFISDLSNADFTGANLTNASFAYCDLSNVSFENAIVKNTIFLNCILNDANFSNAEIKNINITNSVSDSKVFRGDQAAELKRMPNINHFEFGIYTKEANAEYTSRYADYKNNKLGWIPYRTHWTLGIWEPELRGDKGVVGPLHYYSLPNSSLSIRSRVVFDRGFWNTGGRELDITNWLDTFIEYIVEQTLSLSLIEGDGSEAKEFNKLMTKSIRNITHPNEVFLNMDASILLHKFAGMNPINRGGIMFSNEEDWWKNVSLQRCKNEKKDVNAGGDSYPKIFPESCECNSYTPLTHFEYYREFVEKRAKVFDAKILISRESFGIKYSNLNKLVKEYDVEKFDSLQMFPFANLKYNHHLNNRYGVQTVSDFRARFLKENENIELEPLTFNKEEEKKYIQLRVYGDILINFPHDRGKYYFIFSDEVKKLLEYKGDAKSYFLDFKFKLINTKTVNDRLIVYAEPIAASIILENKVIWEGKFLISK